MEPERTRWEIGYGFGSTGHGETMEEDEAERESLEADAKVLPERQLLSLLARDAENDSEAEDEEDA
jgi:hypothetical protein